MSAKSVLFLHRYGPVMASYRFRAQVPSVEVGKINGFRCGLNEPGEYDIVVVSKPNAEDLPTVEHLKREGCKVVVDFADDHFAKDKSYHDFAKLADSIVCGSNVMRGTIYDYTKRDSVAIPDPYEQPEREPHADGDQFIWFGHTRNLPEINRVSGILSGRKVLLATGPKLPEKKRVIWGAEALGQALAASNIALLPTQPGAEYKTPNRLLNAIRAGCFPICMSHPSYKEFNRLVWVGDFQTGLRWTDAFRGDLNGCVKAAQDYIRDRYSPQAIGALWASYLDSV